MAEEKKLNKEQNPKLQEGDKKAAAFARILREQFGDVPLPSVEVRGETERFSPEDRKALEKGYLVYAPRGVSIKTLRGEGRRFWYVNSIFEDLTSTLKSEVAIMKGLFLPKSFNKLPEQQIDMVEEFSRRLKKKIPGVQAIVADEPSVWAEIYHLHFDATGDVLFGSPDFLYTITRAHAGSGFARFGRAGADSGPHVHAWSPGYRYHDVGVVPLVVPA